MECQAISQMIARIKQKRKAYTLLDYLNWDDSKMVPMIINAAPKNQVLWTCSPNTMHPAAAEIKKLLAMLNAVATVEEDAFVSVFEKLYHMATFESMTPKIARTRISCNVRAISNSLSYARHFIVISQHIWRRCKLCEDQRKTAEAPWNYRRKNDRYIESVRCGSHKNYAQWELIYLAAIATSILKLLVSIQWWKIIEGSNSNPNLTIASLLHTTLHFSHW